MSEPRPASPNDSRSASFLDDTQAVCPDDEALVAYLDGELSGDEVRQLEQRLSSNAALQSRLEQLRSTWDLLEELPSAKPNPNFAQSTIEMVAMSAQQLEVRPATTSWRWMSWLAAAVLLPLLAVGGYSAVRSLQRAEERSALEQLHFLADWDALEVVGSYEWLEMLMTVSDLTRVSQRPASATGLGVGLVPKSVSERRQWIAQLSPTDRDRLSANLDKFKQYQRAHNERGTLKVVELANNIYASPDAEKQLQVARSYEFFLREYFGVSDRANHRDEQDLARRLDDLKNRVNRKLVEVYANELKPGSPDLIAVEQWKSDMKAEYNRILPGDSFEDDLRRRLGFRDSAILDEDIDVLLDDLTTEAQEIIGRLPNKDLQRMALIIYFIKPAQPPKTLDRARAIEQFKALPEERRSGLEFLPPDQVQKALGMELQKPAS